MMLDPNTVQVLFADLQPQIVARSKTNSPDALARSAAVLAQVARLLHLPMHLSAVPEGWQRSELIPELARETDGVAQHPRVSASPFLDEATRHRHVVQFNLCRCHRIPRSEVAWRHRCAPWACVILAASEESGRRQISLADYQDRWLMLVLYPRDFSLV